MGCYWIVVRPKSRGGRKFKKEKLEGERRVAEIQDQGVGTSLRVFTYAEQGGKQVGSYM